MASASAHIVAPDRTGARLRHGHDGEALFLLTPRPQCCSTGFDGGRAIPVEGSNGWSLAKETADGGHATALGDAVAGQAGGGIREVMTPLCRGVRRPSRKRSTLRAGTRAQMKSPGGRALLPGEPSWRTLPAAGGSTAARGSASPREAAATSGVA